MGRIGVEREGVGGKDRGGKRGSGWEGQRDTQTSGIFVKYVVCCCL